MRYWRMATLVSLALLSLGAATFCGSAFASDSAFAKSAPDKQQVLNQGYSILYSDVSGLSHADLLLDVKLESDATDRLISDIADYLTTLESGLQQLAHNHPEIRIDLKPLPAIERKAQDAASKARLKGFAPVTGRTGRDFERTLLLTFSGALNSLLHLTQVMAEAEEPHSQQREAFLAEAHTHLDQLYERVLLQLNKRFFIHDAFAGKTGDTDKVGDSEHGEGDK